MITDIETYKVFFLGMFVSAGCFSMSTLFTYGIFGTILFIIGILFFIISVLVFLKPKIFKPLLIKILQKIYSLSGVRNVTEKDGVLHRRNKNEDFYRR